jgi:hypothetical protein
MGTKPKRNTLLRTFNNINGYWSGKTLGMELVPMPIMLIVSGKIYAIGLKFFLKLMILELVLVQNARGCH